MHSEARTMRTGDKIVSSRVKLGKTVKEVGKGPEEVPSEFEPETSIRFLKPMALNIRVN